MLPDWISKEELSIPLKNTNAFAVKTMKTVGKVMSQIQVQRGHEKDHSLPSILKLILTFISILLISITQNKIIVMAYTAFILLYLSTWPAKDLPKIFKSSVFSSVFTFILFIPAIFFKPSLLNNEIFIAVKVFLSVLFVSIFNHTTQWNHITIALKKIHFPGVFIFILDITLKYIVLLGKLIFDLLTSLQLRSVGKNNKKYNSIGGVMGVTFIRGAELNTQMYEAMKCRGFTDDYKGL